VYPTQSLRGQDGGSSQEFADLVRGRGGLLFLSHLEERMDWEVRGLTGVEIYNTHADFKDEKELLAALRNPLWIVQAARLFRKLPPEAFAALLADRAPSRQRWDQLRAQAPPPGVAAHAPHQTVGLVVRLREGNRARLEDALGKKVIDLDVASVPALQD